VPTKLLIIIPVTLASNSCKTAQNSVNIVSITNFSLTDPIKQISPQLLIFAVTENAC